MGQQSEKDVDIQEVVVTEAMRRFLMDFLEARGSTCSHIEAEWFFSELYLSTRL